MVIRLCSRWFDRKDVIYIPEKTRHWLEVPSASTVKVLGAVGEPGRYTFDDTMTLLDPFGPKLEGRPPMPW